jgi:hypothetical protein
VVGLKVGSGVIGVIVGSRVLGLLVGAFDGDNVGSSGEAVVGLTDGGEISAMLGDSVLVNLSQQNKNSPLLLGQQSPVIAMALHVGWSTQYLEQFSGLSSTSSSGVRSFFPLGLDAGL